MAALVGKLRSETGQSFYLCLQALKATSMDMDAARTELSKLVEAQATKTQTAGQTKEQKHGLVGILRLSGDMFGVLEMRCLTDFVAKNPLFSELASKICLSIDRNVASTDVQAHLEKNGLQSDLLEAVGKLKEPITVTRMNLVRREPGELIGIYVHQHVSPGFGTIASIVGISSFSAFDPSSQKLVRSLAKQVTGFNPASVEELLAQEYLFKPEVTVSEFIEETEREIEHPGPITITRMLRYAL